MAIAITQTSIGTVTADDSSSGTIAFTTNVTVAAGDFIVLAITWATGSSITLSSVADNDGGTSYTWNIDEQGAAAGQDSSIAFVSVLATSGLPSGTTITATLSAAAFARSISGSAYSGVKTSSPLDVAQASNGTFAGSNAWSAGALTIQAGSVMISCAHAIGGAVSTATTTSPATQLHSTNDGGSNFTATAAYEIDAVGGSNTIAGTWGAGSRSGGTNSVAYLAAAAASGPSQRFRWRD